MNRLSIGFIEKREVNMIVSYSSTLRSKNEETTINPFTRV